MKKILTLILTFSLIITGGFPAYAEETPVTREVTAEIEMLAQLGVIDGDENLGAILTRGEFAGYVGRMLGISDNYSGNTYFTDVPEDSVINALTELGVFNGTDEHLFEPNEEIVLTHACVALMRALGYRRESGATTVNNYVTLARRLGITDGVNMADKAEAYNVFTMMYNTLVANIAEPSTYIKSGDEWEYTVDKENEITLMERVFKAYVIKGRVTETCYTGLYGASSVKNDRIKINNTEFKCEVDSAAELIGQNIIALVSFKDEESLESVMYITADESKNDTIVISADEIKDFDDYTLRYIKDDEKVKKIEFLPTMSVIYNGVAVGANYKDYFNFGIGTVRCIKGETGRYEVAIIEDIRNFTVSSVDNVEDKIYTDGPAPYNVLDMSYDPEDPPRKIYSVKSGEATGPKTLSHGDSISVIRSNDGTYTMIYLCSETVEGVVKSVSNDTTRKIIIDDAEYEVAPGFDPLKNYTLGAKAKYILDMTGKIAFNGKATATEDKTLGYMYMMSNSSDGFEDKYMYKIFTQNKEHLIVECTENVTFNGERIKKEELPAKLKNNDNSFKRNMVLFKLNNEGKLTYIDTPAETKEQKEAPNSLWKMAEEGRYLYEASCKMFRPRYATSDQTLVFCIPEEDNTYPSEDVDFDVYTNINTVFNGDKTSSGIGLYKFSEDTPFIDVVTQRISGDLNSEIASETDVMLVDEIRNVLDSSGSVVEEIYGLQLKRVVSYRVEPGTNMFGIESGDIIRVKRNAKGYISSIEKLYDLSTGEKSWGDAYESRTFGSAGRFTVGYVDSLFVYNVGSNMQAQSLVNVSEVLGGDVVEAHSFHTNNNDVMIYDSTRRTDKAYIGNAQDVLSYEDAGNEASLVFVHCHGYNRRSIIFYR